MLLMDDTNITDNKVKEHLLRIYNSDFFLKENFPEVMNGDLDGLIWAIGANFINNGPRSQTTFLPLQPFKKWFIKNMKDIKKRPVSTDKISEILSLSDNPLPITHERILIPHDTSEHLITLSMLNLEFNLKNVVELGVLFGESTIALAESVSKINGHLWSIDIDECNKAHELINKGNLNKFWTFIQGNDLEIGKKWNTPIDHLFLDTYHSERQVFSELELFEPHVKENGFISFHDTRSFKGVLPAILKYVKTKNMKFRFYNYVNSNGLAVIRKL